MTSNSTAVCCGAQQHCAGFEYTKKFSFTMVNRPDSDRRTLRDYMWTLQIVMWKQNGENQVRTLDCRDLGRNIVYFTSIGGLNVKVYCTAEGLF